MRGLLALILLSISAWAQTTVINGAGGSATPGGSYSAVQFNSAGSLGGSAGLLFYPYGSGQQGLFIGGHPTVYGAFPVGISVFPASNAVENKWGFEATTDGFGYSEFEYDVFNTATSSLQDLFYAGATATLTGDTVSDYAYYIESTPDYVAELAVRPHLLTVRSGSSICWDSTDSPVPVSGSAPAPDTCLIRPAANTIRLTDGLTGLAVLQAGQFQAPLHTPASSSEACTVGQFSDDASFHYVCTATNVWKRVALSSF